MKYPQLVSMPSAVSDWLEEQLEARGIDSEVYTRYILSLLHAHTLDVIYPEDDLPFTQLKKDGGRGAAFSKRVRRTGAWWRHADADAEQIKRSAAVECLMLAAEQNCEIESLVDELCEKLKEVSSESENCNEINRDSESNTEPLKQRKISPKELAERYYAAFPPLNQKEADSYLASNINLVAGKWPSPEKSLNNIDIIAAAKWTSSGSPKKAKRKPKRQPYDTMKSSSRTCQNRNRFGYKKAHCVRTLTREMADNRANWEFVYNNNNNYEMEDQCLDSLVPTMAEPRPDIDEEDFPVQWMEGWMAEVERNERNIEENNRETSDINLDRSQFLIPPYYNPSSIWSNEEQPTRDRFRNARSDRPRPRPFDYYPGIEGRGEQSSPEEHESAIRDEYQRPIAEEDEESAIKIEYERPFINNFRAQSGGQWAGNTEDRSIQIGGRWSTRMEQPIDLAAAVSQDAIDFGLVRSDGYRSLVDAISSVLTRSDDRESHVSDDLLDWNVQNEANSLLENLGRRYSSPSLFGDFRSLPVDTLMGHGSTDAPIAKNDCLLNELTLSLMMINHSKERSPFGEYVRPTVRNNNNNNVFLPPSGPFSRPFRRPFQGPAMPAKVVPTPQIPPGGMWDSPLVVFRPIQTPPPRSDVKEQKKKKPSTITKYQDGATFAIRGSLDKVEFQRSNSGALFVETEFGENRRCYEYNSQPPSINSANFPRAGPSTERQDFKPKFWASQNDKVRPRGASQTENPSGLLTFAIASSFSAIEEAAYKVMETMDFEKENEKPEEKEEENPEEKEEESVKSPAESKEKCDRCGASKSDISKGLMKFDNPEDSKKTESVSDFAERVWEDSEEKCKLCNGKHQWPNFMQKFDVNWDAETLKDIWEGTGMCRPQSTTEPPSPPPETSSQLREETNEDAEQLLSDINNVQQAFSDSSTVTATQVSYTAPAERKRRHSYMDNDTEMWSFATRLQEDCLVNLSTLPTRRSVTL